MHTHYVVDQGLCGCHERGGYSSVGHIQAMAKRAMYVREKSHHQLLHEWYLRYQRCPPCPIVKISHKDGAWSHADWMANLISSKQVGLLVVRYFSRNDMALGDRVAAEEHHLPNSQ